jgi:hypothetical protein
MYMRIDDSMVGSSSFPIFRAYESMTDINTGTGLFLDQRMHKSISGTALAWTVLATEKMLYYFGGNGYATYAPHCFGDFVSKKLGDAFNTIGIGNGSLNSDVYESTSIKNDLTNIAKHNIARAHTQIGGAIGCGKRSGAIGMSYLGSSTGSSSSLIYPSPIDGALHIAPIEITEGTAGIRGVLPGLWNLLHNSPFNNGDIIIGTGDFTGKKFMAIGNLLGGGSVSMALLEISNTW